METLSECDQAIGLNFPDWHRDISARLDGLGLSDRGKSMRVCMEFLRAVERSYWKHGANQINDKTLILHLHAYCVLRKYARND